ncbi:MAG: CDP-alcohol phosphatidyltransferase family protein [Oligoflexia bacterium]|nr:CDP-alcohol phosphatidyltransferase family protein [Oligoflexia bacterium]
MLQQLLAEYKISIKSPDTEEKLDLLLYRPIGFIFAKIGQILHSTPTHLSLLGLITGVVGGWLYFYHESTISLVLGPILFVISGIFDSSDGQLARLTGQSSQLGLILDGICDNFVFASVYIFSTLATKEIYGYGNWIFLVMLLAGFCHSFQSAILDFYHREYLYFGYGKTEKGDYWNPTIAEAQNNIKESKKFREKIFHKLRYSWIYQQQTLSGRLPKNRLKMRTIILNSADPKRSDFMNAYKKHNLKMLTLWRIGGPNFHTVMIIIFVLFRHFDLYLIYVDLIGINLILLVNKKIQEHQDKKLYNQFNVS